jgi:hypothetical protein
MTSELPPLAELISLSGKLPIAVFLQRFPHHYLLTEAQGGGNPWNVVTEHVVNTGDYPTARVHADSGLLGVAAVMKRPGVNSYASMITLGRARNNDVPIADVSVSKLHAWIRRGDHGTFTSGDFSITDAGSRNGTYVNGETVSREPHPLPVGARLRLGLVEFRFVDAPGLYRALRKAATQSLTDLAR